MWYQCKGDQMSCKKILELITEGDKTASELEQLTGMKRPNITKCLMQGLKDNSFIREKIESSNKLGPRMIYIYKLCKQEN